MCQKIKRKRSKTMKSLKAIETTLLLPWYRSASSKAGRTVAVTASAQAVSLSQIILTKHLERGRDHPAERCHRSLSEASVRTMPAAYSEKSKLGREKCLSPPQAAPTAT